MKAVAFSRFGGPEVMQVADLPVPEPGPGEVRIRVAAATVNPTDIGMRSGGRAAELQKLTPPYVAGMELAGTVDAAGQGGPWQVGERVLAIVVPMRTGRGAQAEYAVVPSNSVVRVPEGVSLELAATLPMNGLTVRRALDLMGLARGQTLLVTGAAGAVGGYGVQLGVADGLRVVGVSAASDEALVRGLGAQDFVARDADLASAVRKIAPQGVDGVLDAAVIGRPILGCVRDGGHVAAVRAFEGEPERGIHVHQVRVSDYAQNQAALQGLADQVASGALTLRVAQTVPPSEAGAAQQKLSAGGVRGRLVIVFATLLLALSMVFGGVAQADSPTHVLVSYSEMSSSPLPLWTAIDNGYFAQNDIQVDAQYIPSTSGVAGLLSGSTNIAFLGGSDILGAVTTGADLVVLADPIAVYPYELLVDPSITDPSQLKGKTIGISNFGSSSDVATRVVLKHFGLDPSTDVTIIAVGNGQNRSAALQSGAIQAEVDAPPTSLPLKAAGFPSLYNLAASGLPNLNNAMVVRRDWRDANRDLVQRFVDAEIQGLNEVRSRPDVGSLSLAKWLNLDSDTATQTAQWGVANVYAVVPWVRPAAFSDSLELLAQSNDRLNGFDPSTIIDNSFVQSAQDRGLTAAN
ncbi:MAG: ABC transporter substrate-binding protein [Chloroflexi bacterium]|nr:ABC transporter substrate-binding protein [Chloroflexota bacterium]